MAILKAGLLREPPSPLYLFDTGLYVKNTHSNVRQNYFCPVYMRHWWCGQRTEENIEPTRTKKTIIHLDASDATHIVLKVWKGGHFSSQLRKHHGFRSIWNQTWLESCVYLAWSFLLRWKGFRTPTFSKFSVWDGHPFRNHMGSAVGSTSLESSEEDRYLLLTTQEAS